MNSMTADLRRLLKMRRCSKYPSLHERQRNCKKRLEINMHYFSEAMQYRQATCNVSVNAEAILTKYCVVEDS